MSGAADQPRGVRPDPRISRRRQAVARSQRRKVAVRTAVAAAAALCLWAAFWSPVLAVRTVKVTGGRHTSSADVARAAGLDSSDRLLAISTERIGTAVEKLPWVLKARVERRLPGTVEVVITERRPELVVAASGKTFTVDGTGRVLTWGRRAGLPVLAGTGARPVRPGRTLRSPSARAAIQVWDRLAPSVRRKVKGVFAPTVERVTVVLESGTSVRIGALERMGAKNSVLRALLADLGRQGRSPSYIDVRVPGSPAVSRTDAG